MWSKCSEKYEASTDGHIRNAKTGRVLHEFVGEDGYMRTQFDGKTKLVHRVIANTFLDNPDRLPEVNHMNGDKSDNSVENLEWCTRSHNQRHAYENGLRSMSGTRNPRCRLSEDDVVFIKQNYISHDKQYGAAALAKRFGVAPQTICAAVHGQNWKGPNRK